MPYIHCYVALIIMEKYPELNERYHNHENKIGVVKVLSIAKHYDDGDEYVVYQGVHTGTIGVIKLSKFNEIVDLPKGNEFVNARPRFYR